MVASATPQSKINSFRIMFLQHGTKTLSNFMIIEFASLSDMYFTKLISKPSDYLP